MTREQALAEARTAVGRATDLARNAEKYASGPDHPHKAAPLAAAGALWADIARAHAAIAAALPEPTPTTDDETPEV